MTLATRCPQCGTTFRVVSDQLKLRKGLVKCGKCLHVFNGIEFLHYFSEPAPTANESALPGASGAPTPEFLGMDDAPVEAAPTGDLTPRIEAPAWGEGQAQIAAPQADPVPAAMAPVEAAPSDGLAQQDAFGAPIASASPSASDLAERPAVPNPIDMQPEPAASTVEIAPIDAGFDAPEFVEPAAAATPTPEPAPTRADASTGHDASANPFEAAAAETVERTPAATPAATDTKPADAPARVPWYARLGQGGAATKPAQAEPAAALRAEAPEESRAEEQKEAHDETREAVRASTQEAAREPAALDVHQAEPAIDEALVAAPAPSSQRDAEIDAIAEMRERVARARQAAEADDGATLSPLTLVDVARPSAEVVEDRFEELPAFLRERRRAPAWLRALVAIFALLAALALLGQGAYVYRAEIAAEFPALRSPLATVCAALPDPLRCEVGLPRHITPLRVVSADLQPGEGGNFNLVVAIHNDDALPMAYPALDVILTDAHTQVLIRRVINADEYLSAHRDAADRRRVGLVGNAETSITVPMHIADEGVVGYTVGIFYP